MSDYPSGSLEDKTPLEQENKEHNSSLYANKRLLILGTLAVMILLAFILRVSFLDNSRHIAEVQYRAALIARSMYFKVTDSIPEWRRIANSNSLQNIPVKEPPITELLTATGYKLLGRENLIIPRLLTSIFWIVGGFFLYKTAYDLVSSEGAIVATAYYLFIPLGVIVSISFQPDSLMIMMFIISLYVILQYYRNPTWYMLFIAAILSGFAILVKPFVLFTISGAFLSLAIYRSKGIRQIFNEKFIVFFTISYIPVVFYYGYEILITGFLMKQAEASFLPQLLFTKDYWKDWLQAAVNAVGLTPLLAAVIGIPMARKGANRALLIGLWGGYFLFCLVFTYHIRFATYYHAQLIPIVALSFTPIVPVIARHIRHVNNRWYWSLFFIAALFLLVYLNIREIRGFISSSANIESQAVAEEIGEIVDHSNRTVYIASYYGRPLEYYGELSGVYWSRSVSDFDRALGIPIELSVEERLNTLGFEPEYFVVTDFNEFSNHHADLNEYLVANCSLLAKTKQYLIYESCSQ